MSKKAEIIEKLLKTRQELKDLVADIAPEGEISELKPGLMA